LKATALAVDAGLLLLLLVVVVVLLLLLLLLPSRTPGSMEAVRPAPDVLSSVSQTPRMLA
jgi:hypothetical protein